MKEIKQKQKESEGTWAVSKSSSFFHLQQTRQDPQALALDISTHQKKVRHRQSGTININKRKAQRPRRKENKETKKKKKKKKKEEEQRRK